MDDGTAAQLFIAVHIAGDGFQAVHSHDNIFQGADIRADFGMFDVRVDNDNIVRADGHGLVICPKKAGTVCDEKDLCTGMGVQHGIPLGAVTGDTDIEKFGDRTINGSGCQRIKNIAAGAHDNRSSLT